jgi:hypothetical protein
MWLKNFSSKRKIIWIHPDESGLKKPTSIGDFIWSNPDASRSKSVV